MIALDYNDSPGYAPNGNVIDNSNIFAGTQYKRTAVSTSSNRPSFDYKGGYYNGNSSTSQPITFSDAILPRADAIARPTVSPAVTTSVVPAPAPYVDSNQNTFANIPAGATPDKYGNFFVNTSASAQTTPAQTTANAAGSGGVVDPNAGILGALASLFGRNVDTATQMAPATMAPYSTDGATAPAATSAPSSLRPLIILLLIGGLGYWLYKRHKAAA